MAREHVWQGVIAGIARFAREVDQQEQINQFINYEYTENMVKRVWRCVEFYQSQVPDENRWHPRGQRLFAEMFTIGEMSRQLMGEGNLSDEEVDGFARGMSIWVNSFFHVKL